MRNIDFSHVNYNITHAVRMRNTHKNSGIPHVICAGFRMWNNEFRMRNLMFCMQITHKINKIHMWHKSFCHMWFACNTHATHIKYCVFRMRKSLLLGSDYDVFIVVHMWIVTILHAICMRTACEKTYSFACGKSAFTCDGPHFAWEPWYFACDSHVFACEKRAFACDACWCEPHAKMFPLLMHDGTVVWSLNDYFFIHDNKVVTYVLPNSHLVCLLFWRHIKYQIYFSH